MNVTKSFSKLRLNLPASWTALSTSSCKYSDNTKSKSARPKSTNTFRKDLLQKTPLGKLEELEGKHPYEEKEPLPEFKDGVNPSTGEVGGPKGPEPTRYGDWERKGRVTDF